MILLRPFLAFLLLVPSVLTAQDLSGRWTGSLTQEGKQVVYHYEVDLRQDGDVVSGTAWSATDDGGSAARFLLTGVWQAPKLTLQEVQQTEPVEPRWCLKYAVLELKPAPGGYRLEGEWRAEGCTPGSMMLTKSASETPSTVMEEELPFTMTGAWTGQLSQSDRDYGFFFELELAAAPSGTSYIVSEDNGGSAYMALQWSYNAATETLVFKELAVAEKTDARWPWCIKRATLQRSRDGGRYVLEGAWTGYIEGHDPANPRAACAPGTLYLEKPVLTRQVVERTEAQQQVYRTENTRSIKVERTVEVESRDLRIRVWDNGTVDGDVCTVFLNGERLLHNYRVSKRRTAIPVTLQETNNFLILHAEDLGDIPPNTVAVSIDDGEREQIIILSSNLKESGAVLIREVKVD